MTSNQCQRLRSSWCLRWCMPICRSDMLQQTYRPCDAGAWHIPTPSTVRVAFSHIPSTGGMSAQETESPLHSSVRIRICVGFIGEQLQDFQNFQQVCFYQLVSTTWTILRSNLVPYRQYQRTTTVKHVWISNKWVCILSFGPKWPYE